MRAREGEGAQGDRAALGQAPACIREVPVTGRTYHQDSGVLSTSLDLKGTPLSQTCFQFPGKTNWEATWGKRQGGPRDGVLGEVRRRLICSFCLSLCLGMTLNYLCLEVKFSS